MDIGMINYTMWELMEKSRWNCCLCVWSLARQSGREAGGDVGKSKGK